MIDWNEELMIFCAMLVGGLLGAGTFHGLRKNKPEKEDSPIRGFAKNPVDYVLSSYAIFFLSVSVASDLLSFRYQSHQPSISNLRLHLFSLALTIGTCLFAWLRCRDLRRIEKSPNDK